MGELNLGPQRLQYWWLWGLSGLSGQPGYWQWHRRGQMADIILIGAHAVYSLPLWTYPERGQCPSLSLAKGSGKG